MVVKELLALVFTIICSITITSASDFAGAQIFNVVLTDPNTLKCIKDAIDDLDVWHQNVTNIEFLVPSNIVQKLKKILEEKKTPYTVTVDDVQKLIDGEKTISRRAVDKKKDNIDLDIYNSLADIYNWMDSLEKSHPKVVSVETIGETSEKRPIKVLKISSGNPNAKAVFIDAGIQAREWIGIATSLHIINKLVTERSKQSKYMLDMDFYILPVFNPDGYEYTQNYNRLWRKNRSKGTECYGVDLNRNFDIHFGVIDDDSGNSCYQIYRGPSAFSEPETKAYSKYILKIKDQLKVYVTLRSFGQMILLPYTYTKNEPPFYRKMLLTANKAIKAIEKAGGQKYTVSKINEIDGLAGGSAIDWMKKKVRVKYTYDIELRDAGFYRYLLPKKFIRPTADEAFEGIKVMVNVAADEISSQKSEAKKGKSKKEN